MLPGKWPASKFCLNLESKIASLLFAMSSKTKILEGSFLNLKSESLARSLGRFGKEIYVFTGALRACTLMENT